MFHDLFRDLLQTASIVIFLPEKYAYLFEYVIQKICLKKTLQNPVASWTLVLQQQSLYVLKPKGSELVI